MAVKQTGKLERVHPVPLRRLKLDEVLPLGEGVLQRLTEALAAAVD
jgi:hypothetical protein